MNNLDKHSYKESMRKIMPAAACQKMAASGEIFIVQDFVYTLGLFGIKEILLWYFWNSIYFKKPQKDLFGEVQILSFSKQKQNGLFKFQKLY